MSFCKKHAGAGAAPAFLRLCLMWDARVREGEQCVLSRRMYALLPRGAAAPLVSRAELPERYRGVCAAALGSGASTRHFTCPAGECLLGSDSEGNGKILLCLNLSFFFSFIVCLQENELS